MMTGGLGVAANGNKNVYHYIENACSPSAHASTMYNISAKSKHTVVLHQSQNT